MRGAVPMIAALLAAGPAGAQQLPGDVAEGAALARKVCAECHRVAKDDLTMKSGSGPSFAEIARHPTSTPLGLRVFLRSPHKNMPNLVLSDAEIDDAIAYILSLKQ